MAKRGEWRARYRQIVARAWMDEAFKSRLLTNPSEVLREEGLPLPAGANVHIFENTAQDIYLSIPRKPARLTDDELDSVAGGASVVSDITGD